MEEKINQGQSGSIEVERGQGQRMQQGANRTFIAIVLGICFALIAALFIYGELNPPPMPPREVSVVADGGTLTIATDSADLGKPNGIVVVKGDPYTKSSGFYASFYVDAQWAEGGKAINIQGNGYEVVWSAVPDDNSYENVQFSHSGPASRKDDGLILELNAIGDGQVAQLRELVEATRTVTLEDGSTKEMRANTAFIIIGEDRLKAVEPQFN